MAHLLGSRFCIESLRNDVTDLQSSIIDIFSRVGPVRSPSWKFPDRDASDLDLTELLDMYDWSEDAEERQVAHVCLLELLIDRLLLLLLAICQYLKQIHSSSPTQRENMPNSVGLVARKLWSELIQTGRHLVQLQEEKRKMSRETTQLQSEMSHVKHEMDALRDGTSTVCSRLNALPIPLNDLDTSVAADLLSPQSFSISRDEYNKSCQTYETAFVPCESCDLVQKKVRAVGKIFSDICSSQGLPSSIQQQMSLCEEIEWMNGNEIDRWLTEEGKDIERITKHFEKVDERIKSLEKEITDERATNSGLQEKLEKNEKELRGEKQTKFTQRKYYERKIDEEKAESKNALDKLREEKGRVERERDEWMRKYNAMESLCENEKINSQALKDTIEQMKSDMESILKTSDRVKTVESDKIRIQNDLHDALEKLSLLEKEKNVERAKSKNAYRQSESLQNKQESLVSRLDELHTENEELRSDLSKMEDENVIMQERLEDASKEKIMAQKHCTDFKEEISHLVQEKGALKKEVEAVKNDLAECQVSLNRIQSEQKLMTEYPDLNGPVNPQMSGTGDIRVDMENQVEANSLRIKVLEEQNSVLRNSILKILQAQTNPQVQENTYPSVPVPLWNVESATVRKTTCDNGEELEERGADENHKQRSTPDTERSLSPIDAMFIRRNDMPVTHKPKKSQNSSRPPSGKKPGGKYESFVHSTNRKQNSSRTQSASSISAYIKLKNAGMLRPKSGKSRSPSDCLDSEAHEVFSCYKCDKMYNSQADLEVHKSYCYG